MRRQRVGAWIVLLAALVLGGGAPGEQALAAGAEELRVLGVSTSVAPLDLNRVAPAVMAEHALHQPSIAALRKVGKNRYRTSVGREIQLAARVDPRSLASSLEWRVVAGRRLLAVRRGAEVTVAFGRPGVYAVEVGPRRLVFEIYRTVLTSHASGRDTVPAGEPVTFTAATVPPGFEREITWLASGGDGSAAPVLGRGPSFTVTFDHAATGRMGVKADNAAFTQSEDLPDDAGVAVALFQVDATLGAASVVDSDWGSADLTFVGTPGIQYFNLSLNGFWAVQNMPVLSNEGAGVIQTQTFNFALGVPSGTPVSSINHGLALTSSVLPGPPPMTGTAIVADRTVLIQSGEEGESLFLTPARPAIGGQAQTFALVNLIPSEEGEEEEEEMDEARVEPAFNFGVPNQEVGVNECVPGAISNSLKFLKMQGLDLPDDAISIDAMKPATGWTREGGASTATFNPPAWWERKDQHMQDNGLPVTTTTTMSLADALAAVGRHCDVELRVQGHAAVVTGIVPLANGDYGIIIQHDTNQGAAGGTKSEVVIYKASDGTLWDGWGINGKELDRFVIECPST